MISSKVLRVLETLYSGLPVNLNGYEYYLGADNNLGVQMKVEVSGVFVPNVNAQGEPLIHAVDWSLKDFLTACENLPDQELNTTCVKTPPPKNTNPLNVNGEERKYEMECNRYLFEYPKFLGGRIENLGHMFQNSGSIPLSELKHWVNSITKYIYKMLDFAESAVYYVKYGRDSKTDPDAAHLLKEPETPCYNDDDIPF
jgi:hypothetical protein